MLVAAGAPEDGSAASATGAVGFWDLTNRQDWAACEGVQRGVAGRGYRQGPLSDAEGNVWQFIAMVARGYLAGRLAGPVPDLASSGVER